MCCLPDSCPLMNTCKAWPADKIVRKGYFPLFRNSSLASIITLGRKENTFNPWHMKFIRKCFVNKYTKKKKNKEKTLHRFLLLTLSSTTNSLRHLLLYLSAPITRPLWKNRRHKTLPLHCMHPKRILHE